MMLRLVFCLSLLGLVFADELPDETKLKGPLAVFSQYLGNWESHTTLGKSQWIKEEFKFVGDSYSEAIVKGRFIEINYKGQFYQSRAILGWNRDEKIYERWVFSSDGKTQYWTGSWDEENQQFTWELNDPTEKFKGSLVETFVAEDNLQSHFQIINLAGDVLMEAKSELILLHR
ncbi:MAG: hypothetical protein MK193_13730 [Lentisphaeria bacterium]|nr:hypothetical protein [Lentisphaeria bacterium]